MPINFPSFPQNWRLPLFWSEVDTSKASTLEAGNKPAVLVGQMLATGTATPNVIIAVGSVAQAKALFGVGSMLAASVNRFFAIAPNATLLCLPLPAPTGTAATGTTTISTAANAAGVYTTYIAGQRVQIVVQPTDTTANIATNLAAAINLLTDLPVTATVATNVVTTTARWNGTTGNDIVIVENFGGTLAGESMPAGMTTAIAAMSGGTGAPSMTTAIANMGDEIVKFFGVPYTDSTSLQAWDTELGFSSSGRWGWMRQLRGKGMYSARRDTYSNQYTWGSTGNSGVQSIMDVEPTSPSPIWEWTAAYLAQAVNGFTEDPARPLQTLELTGILPAPRQDRRTKGQMNTLTGLGLAVQKVGPNGYPQIQYEASRWQLNSYGQPDNALQLMTTLSTLDELLDRMEQSITSKYPRHKLANNGTRFSAGQAIITPNVAKAELIAEYGQCEFDGLVENSDQFNNNLVVERDSRNPNRLNVLYPPDVINQLRVFAVLAQYRLQYPDQPIAA